MAQEKLLLIDGSSLAFRAFYAMYTQMDRFTNKDGIHTNAVMTFNNMLDNVMDEFKPQHVLVAFDKSGGTFRTKMFDDYKGQRQKAPSEFIEQLPYIHELLDDHGIRHYALQDYEADDIIGTLSREAEARGWHTDIITGDRDLTQLATDNVTVQVTRKASASWNRSRRPTLRTPWV